MRPNNFNSRTSCEVRHVRTGFLVSQNRISTHAPLARCDPRGNSVCEHGQKFQLTHLLRGATTEISAPILDNSISTHAPLARCDVSTQSDRTRRTISTHAPLARCDRSACIPPLPSSNFNSRTSCEVRPDRRTGNRQEIADFNSRTSCEVRPEWEVR